MNSLIERYRVFLCAESYLQADHASQSFYILLLSSGFEFFKCCDAKTKTIVNYLAVILTLELLAKL